MVARNKLKSLSGKVFEALTVAVRVEAFRRAAALESFQKVPNWQKAIAYLADVAAGEEAYEDYLIDAARDRLVTHRPTFKKTIEKAIGLTGDLSNLVSELRGAYDDCNEWNRLSGQLDRCLSKLG